MTGLHRRTLDFIIAYTAQHRHPPCYSEIGKAVGLKTPSVHRVVHLLVDEGCIKLTPHRRRSIEVIDPKYQDATVDFLPHHLAVWVKTVAGGAGVKPIDVVIEAVRDGYARLRKSEQTVSRGTSAPERLRA